MLDSVIQFKSIDLQSDPLDRWANFVDWCVNMTNWKCKREAHGYVPIVIGMEQ